VCPKEIHKGETESINPVADESIQSSTFFTESLSVAIHFILVISETVVPSVGESM